jgi:hypothetical protein
MDDSKSSEIEVTAGYCRPPPSTHNIPTNNQIEFLGETVLLDLDDQDGGGGGTGTTTAAQ